MSDRLKKLERTEQYGLNEYTLAEVLLALNAAIARINEVEARYEDTSYAFETHTHTLDFGNEVTDDIGYAVRKHDTPPIPGGDDGK